MSDVLLVTSRDPFCGISCHSDMLMEAVRQADPTLSIEASAVTLDPHARAQWTSTPPAVVLLNYHRALHSRWTPEAVQWVKAMGLKVVVIFHDTFGELPTDDLSLRLNDLADAFIVHEPCVGLPKALYWRQGVPEYDFDGQWPIGRRSRPFVGTVGHDFPWKNYGLLCEMATSIGWGVMLFVPAMSPEREYELRSMNPWLTVRRGFSTQYVIAGLRVCDATAFLYTCGNSGTSAAIRLGIGAHKPVIAFSSCRQNRDLLNNSVANRAIHWTDTFEGVKDALRRLPLTRLDPGIVELAEQDSWRHLGKKYAGLLRGLL